MKVQLKKYGEILISRPSGKEAVASFFAYQTKSHRDSRAELDFAGLISMAPSWLDEFVTGLKTNGYEVTYLPSKNPSVIQSIKTIDEGKKIHPWRLCPVGEHWVVTHKMKVPSSKKYPAGHDTIRHAHCARNPSGKDQLYPEEVLEISKQNFSNIKDRPCSSRLGFGAKGNRFDELIAGWTKYWNDIFKPATPLDPNLVKALIASESGFIEKRLAVKTNSNSARGLMQITNQTRKILCDEKGELKDHFVTFTKEDLNDPNNNICAGIRWLFHKKNLASKKREVSWEEAVFEYKGAKNASKKRAKEIMDNFRDFYLKCKKSQRN